MFAERPRRRAVHYHCADSISLITCRQLSRPRARASYFVRFPAAAEGCQSDIGERAADISAGSCGCCSPS